MAQHDPDRRRFLLATIVTLLALPALWWANQEDDSGAPTVASVGVDVGANTATATGNDAPAGDGDDELGQQAPVFLDGPTTGIGGVADIAVPAAPANESVTGTAGYSSAISNTSTCFVKGFQQGTTIRVVNLDNSRSLDCVVSRAPESQRTDVVLSTSAYLTLADLTDAPIPVELRQ